MGNDNSARATKIRKLCAECGAEFTVWRYRANTANYCSTKCVSVARSGRQMMKRTCVACGVEFLARAAVVKHDPRGGRACSRACVRKLRGLYATPPTERFWQCVDRDGPVPEHVPELGCCWVWSRRVEPSGYAQFSLSHERHVSAHRYSYEVSVGPIPDGMIIMHLCDNRRCVRPEHLRAGTHLENSADCVSKGRHARGENTPRATLRENEVRQILLSQENLETTARRFGVSMTTISSIRLRRTWKHVKI